MKRPRTEAEKTALREKRAESRRKNQQDRMEQVRLGRLKTNFNYHIGIEYDYYHPCDNDPSICDNDFCRCGEVRNARIEGFLDAHEMAEVHIKSIGHFDEIIHYATERVFASLLRKNGNDVLDIEIKPDYYGEVIRGVFLCGDCQEVVNAIPMEDFNEAVRYALLEEYDWILPELEKATFAIEEVEMERIKLPNHHQMVKTSKMEHNLKAEDFDARKGPAKRIIGLVRQKDGFYELIDGYHRMANAKKGGLKKVSVLVATKGE